MRTLLQVNCKVIRNFLIRVCRGVRGLRIKSFTLATVVLFASSLACKATQIPPPAFGTLSAYNLVALGTVNSSGQTVIAGTVSTTADVTGRIAAADEVLKGTTIASGLVNGPDPYGSLTTFSLVSTNGFTGDPTFNIDNNGAHSSVFSPSGSAKLNFNSPSSGSLVTTGSSGINFNALRTSLDSETGYLGSLAANGQNLGTGNNKYGNPSNFVLLGTSTTLNIFDVTPAEFASTNNPLNVVVPAGSTVIINVIGTSATGYSFTAGASILLNGQQNFAPNNYNNDQILINFPNATSIDVTGGQLDASVLAPFAKLSGNQDLDGNIIAAQIDSTGEVHNEEFVGTLPSPPTRSDASPVPEPGTLALVGTGILSVAGTLRRKK
jgi:choice-of-anchor A domain-containing protein